MCLLSIMKWDVTVTQKVVRHETETATLLGTPRHGTHVKLLFRRHALDSDMINFVFFCFTYTCLSSVSITGNNVIIILVETTHS